MSICVSPQPTISDLQVSKFFEPTDETLSTVDSWLSQNNITYSAVSPAGDIIQFTIPVAQANDLLATQFSIYTHVETGKTSIRTLEYSIPATLHEHVVFVHPTTTFTRPMAARPKFYAVGLKREVSAHNAGPAHSLATVPAGCASVITPSCLQECVPSILFLWC